MSAAPPRPPARPRTRGPFELGLEVGIGLVFVAFFAWFVGVVIEIAGSYLIWKDQSPVEHSRKMVLQDLEYIGAAPRSLLIEDTNAFSRKLIVWVRYPFDKLRIQEWYERSLAPTTGATDTNRTPLPDGIKEGMRSASSMLSSLAMTSMYVAMDVVLRMSVAVYALPAFILACLLGTVDGLVRRDLRRWGGGRESSFVYHHAKRYTVWSLTGGFGLYLSWPFGGFNPAYMVLLFTVLVAATLSTTVGAFKKYV